MYKGFSVFLAVASVVSTLSAAPYIQREIENRIDLDFLEAAPRFGAFDTDMLSFQLPICRAGMRQPKGWAFAHDSLGDYVLNCVGGRCEEDPTAIYFSHDSWIRLGALGQANSGMYCKYLEDDDIQRENFVRVIVNKEMGQLCQKPIAQLSVPRQHVHQQKVIGRMRFSSAPRLPKGSLIVELKSYEDSEAKWQIIAHASGTVGDGYDDISEWTVEGEAQAGQPLRLSLRLSESVCKRVAASDDAITIYIYGAKVEF